MTAGSARPDPAFHRPFHPPYHLPQNRRQWLQGGIAAAIAAGWMPANVQSSQLPASQLPTGQSPDGTDADLPGGIVDTNVHLFQWPFRRLPLGETERLVAALHGLGVAEAWAGSYESLLHRDLAAANRRLVAECQRYPEFSPVGSVNLSLPGWQQDLRWCLEQPRMPAIRLYPGYHGYLLTDARMAALLEQTAAATRLVQIAVALEDTRTHHSLVRVPDVDLVPLVDLLRRIPSALVQLLNYRPAGRVFEQLAALPSVCFDTARVESTDGVPQLVQRVGVQRVLFGSHAPFLIPAAALIRVQESGQLDGPALRAVCRENALQRVSSRNTPSPARVQPIEVRGLPAAPQLQGYRIWDSYFTPSHDRPGPDGGSRIIADIERAMPAIERGEFEKLCYFPHVGIGTTTDREFEKLAREQPDVVLKPLRRWPNLLLGMIQLNVNDVPASLDALNRWLRDGPMVGVYFSGGGGPGAQCCTHPNMYPLVERIAALRGVIIQHTWFKTGGKDSASESTPAELVELAARFPEQKFLCAHAGGEWQLGIRAVRESPNILVETSGFDATAGFIEMAVRELGPTRVVFGSHLPSRSLGTELSKVVAANISEPDKRLILGENFRQLLQPILSK